MRLNVPLGQLEALLYKNLDSMWIDVALQKNRFYCQCVGR